MTKKRRPKKEVGDSIKWKIYGVLTIPLFFLVVYLLIQFMDYKTSRDALEQGLAYEMDGNLINADRSYHNSIVYDQECVECFIERGRFFYDRHQDYSSAEYNFNRAKRYADEDDLTGYFYELQGKTCYQLGDLPTASVKLSKALELGSDDSTHFYLALTERDLVGSTENVLAALQEFDQLHPLGYKTNLELGRTLFFLNRFEEAAEKLALAKEIKTGNKDLILLASNNEIALGDTLSGCEKIVDLMKAYDNDAEEIFDQHCWKYDLGVPRGL